MEKTWLDTNITALHAINVGVKPTAQANLETIDSEEIKTGECQEGTRQ